MFSADSNTPLLWFIMLVFIPVLMVMFAVAVGMALRHRLRGNPRLIGQIRLFSLACALGLLAVALAELVFYRVLDGLLVLWVAPLLLAAAMQEPRAKPRRAAAKRRRK